MSNTSPAVLMALAIESHGLFEAHKVPVTYSGIGKVNAAHRTMQLIAQGARVILNLGTAGSLTFKPLTLVQVHRFVQRDMDLTPLGTPLGMTPMDDIPGAIDVQTLDLGFARGVCGTADVFEIGPPRLPCDLVDMEGYAIAKVCAREKVPLHCYKFITDGSDGEAHQHWRDNLKAAAEQLWQVYEQFVARTR
jgi:adenosylhomocysteine nucleosidase